MTHRAFILSRPEDYQLALISQSHLKKRGWLAQIMIDPTEWKEPPPGTIHRRYGTQGRGMFGLKCAFEIMAGIVNCSMPGDIVAKFDCDIAITEEASDWLKWANQARCFSLGGRVWGGCWSAPWNQAEDAAFDKLVLFDECSCPESALALKALDSHDNRLLTVPSMIAEKWQPGREWRHNAAAVTLPTRCSGLSRLECGDQLFRHLA